jgi:hypothetical protein
MVEDKTIVQVATIAAGVIIFLVLSYFNNGDLTPYMPLITGILGFLVPSPVNTQKLGLQKLMKK